MAIVVCHRHFLESRCAQRGVPIDSAMACVVRTDGDVLSIDTSHPSYPATAVRQPPERRTSQPAARVAAPTKGPGTELKKLLAKIGITATPTCSCNARARKMDEMEAREPGWCEARLDEIVGWLREEATKRKLPFVDLAGRVLVRRAIANARKAANAERPSLSAGG
jgi:hypothetical protein